MFFKNSLIFCCIVVFTIIGTTVFANESLVYVERLRESHNENPRRWGMWLLIPNLILSFFTSIIFILASILNWCDYRSMQVSGILSHSVGKFNSSVSKFPSDRLKNLFDNLVKRNFSFSIYIVIQQQH